MPDVTLHDNKYNRIVMDPNKSSVAGPAYTIDLIPTEGHYERRLQYVSILICCTRWAKHVFLSFFFCCCFLPEVTMLTGC